MKKVNVLTTGNAYKKIQIIVVNVIKDSIIMIVL